MLAKRRKVDDECRSFNDKWTEKYFSILHFGKPTCLICNQSVAVNKEFNIKRHFMRQSIRSFRSTEVKQKKDKINRLKLCLEKQCSIFQKQNTESEKNTQASYEVAKLIAKNIKPFTDGDFVKDCLMAVVEVICPEKKKIILQC